MESVFVIDAVRTAVGKYAGALSLVRPDDLLAVVIRAIVERQPAIVPEDIEDVIAGCANQSGEDNRNVARMSTLLADLPLSVGGITVNRLCASGLQAIMDASRAIMCGDGAVYLAGGVESMSRAPFVMAKSETAFNRVPEVYDTTLGWRFPNKKLSEKHYPFTMGETAENVAEKWKVSRTEQDEFAFTSQQKYFEAFRAGKFSREIIPVQVPAGRGQFLVFEQDEHPRESTLDKLGQLKPAFKNNGTVTAGNASGINDGAAMLVLASGKYVEEKKLEPMAHVVSMAIAGVDPAVMGIGPVEAVRKALKRASLQISDIGLVELNEAFASQSIACIRELGLDPKIVNVNGGSIAIGHPLGASGARISTTLLHEMQRQNIRYGIATMCVGVGQGAAIVFENVGKK